MKYAVYALRSRTLCRVFPMQELFDKPIFVGSYKRLKTAKRKRAEWNKGRVITIDPGGRITDHGPSMRKVWIEEIPE